MSDSDLVTVTDAAGRVNGERYIDVPGIQHRQPERGRVTAQGRRIDDGSVCPLLVVREADGSWSFHAPDASGAYLTCDLVVALAESILGVPDDLVHVC